MFSSSQKLRLSLTALVFILCIFTVSVTSQIAGGLTDTTRTDLGGKHYISGTVFLPSGVPVNTRITVRLTSMTAGEIIGSTDDRGSFVFSGLPEGSYVVTVVESGQYEMAVRHVDISVSRGSMPQAFNLTIRLSEKRGDEKKPGVINAESSKTPKKALEHYTKALDLSNKGDHNKAVKELRLALSIYPSFVAALTELGIQYINLNDMQKAEEAFLSAINIDPQAFEPHVNYGVLLVRSKRFSEAEPILQKSLQQKSGHSVAHYYLGRAFVGLSRFEDAVTEYKKAIEFGGANAREAHRMLGSVYLEMGEDKLAVSSLEAYLELFPKAPDADKLRDVIQALKERSSDQ